jgi:hypothetical protein
MLIRTDLAFPVCVYTDDCVEITTNSMIDRGFTNHADGSSPFTGNLRDGQCIGTTSGIYAVFTV